MDPVRRFHVRLPVGDQPRDASDEARHRSGDRKAARVELQRERSLAPPGGPASDVALPKPIALCPVQLVEGGLHEVAALEQP
jgi:hypothetical protein